MNFHLHLLTLVYLLDGLPDSSEMSPRLSALNDSETSSNSVSTVSGDWISNTELDIPIDPRGIHVVRDYGRRGYLLDGICKMTVKCLIIQCAISIVVFSGFFVLVLLKM